MPCEHCDAQTGSGRRLCRQCELAERPTPAEAADRRSDDDEVLACPHCDGTRVRERLPSDHPRAVTESRKGDHEARYYCDDCQTVVLAPVCRPPRADRSVHGPAKTLAETDAGEVSNGE